MFQTIFNFIPEHDIIDIPEDQIVDLTPQTENNPQDNCDECLTEIQNSL